MRNSKDKKPLRRRMVEIAKKKGIRCAAAECSCSVNTVRKWLRRYNELGDQGFKELSRRPYKDHKQGFKASRLH
jgi:transposase